MKTNLGRIDRGVRIFLSILLVDLWMKDSMSRIEGIIILFIPLYLFLTSFIGYCPVYHLFRISTKRKNIQSQRK